ncbi:MAG: SURF1 family protein [Marmoricola sp.]
MPRGGASALLGSRAWAAHLLMVLAAAAAVALGIWQLDVWQASRAAAGQTLVHADPVPLAGLMGGDSPFPGDAVGQPVTFRGSWLPAGTVYVSGERHAGRRGYWVVTPVRIGRSAMPVVRGWSAQPQAPAPQGEVAVTGWLQPSAGTGEADADPHDDVITSMRIASMTQHVRTDLYSGYVVSSALRPAGTASSGLAAVRPAAPPKASATTALRNFLYALQWWFFAGFAVYVWFRWCQDEVRGRPVEDSSRPDAGAPVAEPAGTVES